ncbi:MAG: hypothetical protein GX166_03295 [Clostridiaceae bacterium]|nr:hypothetical protein [Clostridiaceae bacterium]
MERVSEVKEKDFLKNVIEDNVIQKERIRENILNKEYKKEVIPMKKKLYMAASIVLVFLIVFATYAYVDAKEYKEAVLFLNEIGIQEGMLSRSEAKKVYKDIKSGSFDEPVTNAVLTKVAENYGLNVENQGPEEIYATIRTYNMLTYTKRISSEDVLKIDKGMTYKDIIKLLGETKDIGTIDEHVLMYVVDGTKLLYLKFSDEDEVCQRTGKELLDTLVNAVQDQKDKNTFNAIVINKSKNHVFLSCPTYELFDSIYLIIDDKTEIVFEDGTKATVNDIEGEVIATFTGGIRESYPPQANAKKIVIKR